MNRIFFEDFPSTRTPLSAENMNLLQDNVENAIIQEKNERLNTDTNLQNQITNGLNNISTGTPLFASSVSEMTNTSRVYVNTSDGYLYNYNGSTWVKGKIYQATGIGYKQIKSNQVDDYISKAIQMDKLPINFGGLNIEQFDWELGGIEPSDGSPLASNTTIRTSNFVNLNKDYLGINVNNSFNLSVYLVIYQLNNKLKNLTELRSFPFVYKKVSDEKIKLVISSKGSEVYTDKVYEVSQRINFFGINSINDTVDFLKNIINKNSFDLLTKNYTQLDLGNFEEGAFNSDGTVMKLDNYLRTSKIALNNGNSAIGKKVIFKDIWKQYIKNKYFTGFLYKESNSTGKRLYFEDFNVEGDTLSYDITDDYKYIAFTVKTDSPSAIRLRQFKETLGLYIIDNIEDKKDRPQNGIVHFSNKINVNFPTENDSLQIQDSETLYNDNAILFLPTNYKKYGKPTQLVIYCHGAGTHITESTTSLNEPVTTLVKMGYAVLDCNGIPEEISQNSGLHYGNPMTLQCYLKAYRYAIENYNLTERVFVVGTSMGGLSSNMLVQSGSIPVIAQANYCPVTDHFKQAWCNPWQSGQRQRIAQLFNFTGQAPTFTATGYPTADEIQYYKNNIDKIIGYNPMMKNTVNWNNEYLNNYNNSTEMNNYKSLIKYHNVPLKIWHNDDDNTVHSRYSEYYVKSIKNSGGLAILRKFPSGNHNAWDNGNTITIQDVDGNNITIKASVYELLLWFKRFK